MGSKLIELAVFENLKILVMICSFTIVNLAMILLVLFAAIKAVNYVGGVGASVASAIKYLGA